MKNDISASEQRALKLGEWVNQGNLASTLGLTTRRVRQLICDRILPKDRDGKWHLPTCCDRYEIFISKTDRDLQDVSNDLEQRSKELEDILDTLADAKDDTWRRELLPKAVAMHGEVFELLAFMISA